MREAERLDNAEEILELPISSQFFTGQSKAKFVILDITEYGKDNAKVKLLTKLMELRR